MPETDEEIEVRIIEACKETKKSIHVNIKRLARDFKVPYPRLKERLKGTKSRIHMNRDWARRRLTATQESALIQWIRAQCVAEQSPTSFDIKDAANRIMEQAPRNGIRMPVSKTWVSGFLARKLPSDMTYEYPKSSYGAQSRAEAGFDASSGSNSSPEDADINGPLKKWGKDFKVVSVIDPSLVSKPSPASNPRPLKRGRQPKDVSIIDTSPASNPSLVPEPSSVSNHPPVLNVPPISNPQASEPSNSASPMPPYSGERYISPLDDPKIRLGLDWRLMRQKYRENKELMERARWDCDAMEEVLRTHRQLESPEPEDIKVDLFAGMRV